MDDIYCYSFVEDEPTAAVAKRLVELRNMQHRYKVFFVDGFPRVTGGFGDLKKKCPDLLKMASAGLHAFVITDLDAGACAGELINDWFNAPPPLPGELVFRVAVREVESWILADVNAWASFIGIPVANFSASPDDLADPKRHLLTVIQQKGRQKRHKDMLPRETASIGPRYNEVLCDFIIDGWSPARAAKNSPSLRRAINALDRL